jgi:DNA-binding NarL/FixJ family response regulator
MLVDDQSLFREGLATLLSVWDEIEVVGEAGNGQEALDLVANYRPHVILMDLRMPVLGGVVATRRLKNIYPAAKVIVLTTFDDDEHVMEGLRAGAVGYLLKDVASEKLVEAIRAASKGESFLQPSIAAKVIAELMRSDPLSSPDRTNQELIEPLSERELEILSCLTEGDSNREISGKLFITEGTVKNHITNILGKLGVRDRTQAALKAKELGLV